MAVRKDDFPAALSSWAIRFLGIVKAVWSSAGLRLGDAGDPTASLDVVNSGSTTDVRIASGASETTAWKLEAADTDNTFQLIDDVNARSVAIINQGAPSNSLRINSSGYIGMGPLGPASPVRQFHLRTAETLTFVRLESTAVNSRVGYEVKNDAQIWQMRVETTDDFKIVDSTGATQPVLVEPAAGTDSLHISSSGFTGLGEPSPSTRLHVDGAITLNERTSEPSDPADGQAVIWLTDGTGFGDDGDVCVKVNVGGTVKSAVLFDYSAA